MLDNVLPIPEAESQPFYSMVLKLACVHIHAHNLHSRSGGGFEGLQWTHPGAGGKRHFPISAGTGLGTGADARKSGLGGGLVALEGRFRDPGRVRRAGARQIGSVGGRPIAKTKVRGRMPWGAVSGAHRLPLHEEGILGTWWWFS